MKCVPAKHVPAYAVGAIALALASIGGTVHAQTTLTISSWAPARHSMTTEVTMGWAAEVEKASNGRLKFQLLAKHPVAAPGTFDAVAEGLVDVAYTGPNYTPARHLLTQLGELPGGGTTSEINSVAYNRIHWKYLHQAGEFKGVKLLGVFTHGPGQMFNTKRPINSAADLKGLKIRTGGGVGEKIAQAFGAASFLKPAPESYELLSSGIADGVFFPLESIVAFKLEKVIKYGTLFPGGFYNQGFAFMMNEAKWNTLSKQDQEAIMSASGERLAHIAGQAWDKSDRTAMEALKTSGVQLAPASARLLKDAQDATKVVLDDWMKQATAKGVDGPKVYAEFHAELKRVAAGK